MGRKSKFKNGKEVIVKNTLLYNGRKGVIENPKERDSEDFWDLNVRLDDDRLIGVTIDQIVLSH